MPYHWTPATRDTPECLTLWPYRSLPRRGFVWFIGGTAALLALPLLAVLGSPILWALLPFLLGAVAAIWFALEKSYRDGGIVETLTLTGDLVSLTRSGPKGQQSWQANTHWVQVSLYPTDGPVPDYLTLRGAGREVELGAFLTPEERKTLASELRQRLRAARGPTG